MKRLISLGIVFLLITSMFSVLVSGVHAAAGDPYIDMSNTYSTDNQYDFGSTIEIYVDVDCSPGPRTVDVFTHFQTPNDDIVDGDSYYGWVVQGTVNDQKLFTLNLAYEYMQYVGMQWHVTIEVRDHTTYSSYDSRRVFFAIGPILVDHFTCKDPHNAYATMTTTFYHTETAHDYTVWDTHNLWIGYSVTWDFNGPSTSHLIAGPQNLPAGYSSFWVEGGITGGAVGSWYVDVLLEDKFRARDGFDIIATTLPALGVNLISPPDGSTLQTIPIELKARLTSGGSAVQSALVRFYVGGTEVGSASSDSSGYASINYSPSPGTYSWYAKAEKAGYTEDTSSTWSFTYSLPTQPDFSVEADPSVMSIQAGSSGSTTIHVDSLNNLDADVSLSISNLPAGVSASFSTNPVRPPKNGRGSSILTLTLSLTATLGTYYLKVEGTCVSPSLTHGYEIQLTIGSPQEHTISLKSRTADGFENIGGISFAGVSYTLPDSVNKVSGTYNILALPQGSYSFHHWEYSGNVVPSDIYSVNTQVSVTGSGNVVAVFYLDIRLFFSTGENYFPMSLDFDHDGSISNNARLVSSNHQIDQLRDLDGDNGRINGIRLDAPSYVRAQDFGSYKIIQYWIYYAKDDKYLSPHEHDFESLFVLLDSAYAISKVSLGQHLWTNNYAASLSVFGLPVKTLTVAVEKHGHGMLLFTSSGWLKPDNSFSVPSTVLAPFDWQYDSNEIATLYPWRIYDGVNPTDDGFGNPNLLRTGTNYAILTPTTVTKFLAAFTSITGSLSQSGIELINDAKAAKALWDSVTFVDYFYEIGSSERESLLLDSSEPYQIAFLNLPIHQFYIQAPWLREEFRNPIDRFSRVGFSYLWTKLGVKIIASAISLCLGGTLSLVVGGISFITDVLWDPVNGTITDTAGNVVGYKDGQWVNEIPGVFVVWRDAEFDSYLILGNSSSLTYVAQTTELATSYTLNFGALYTDSSIADFNATDIPLQSDSVHTYQINWDLLKDGQEGTIVSIDSDRDGISEQIIRTGTTLTADQVGVGYAYTDKSQYMEGQIITVGFQNTGSNVITLPNTAPWVILDNSMNIICHAVGATIPVDIGPEERKEWQWPQLDDGGQQVPPGQYFFQIVTSAGTFTASFEIVGMPDLTITEAYWDPPEPLEGGTLTVYLTEANIGTADAGPHVDRIIVNGIAHDLPDPGLPVGSRTWHFTVVPTGNIYYQVTIILDVHSDVAEKDETNNVWQGEIAFWAHILPTAGQTDIDISTEAGITYAEVTLTFPNTGYRVSNWNLPIRDLSQISADSEVWDWTGVTGLAIFSISHTYDLGHLEDGTYTFTYKAWGQIVKAATFTIDTAPPATNIVLLGDLGLNGWYVSQVQVKLIASDDTSGVFRTYYILDSGPQTEYDGLPFTVSEDGSHVVQFWSVDSLGNEETHETESFKIDKTTPTLTKSLSGTAGSNGWFVSDVQVTLTASDASPGSGVALLEYNLNGASWIVYTVPFTISAEGANTLEHKVTDNAGNVYVLATQTIKIDNSDPSVSITSPGNGEHFDVGPASVTGTASDGAGVLKVGVKVDGASFADATPAGVGDWSTWSFAASLSVGTHTITARVTDLGGTTAEDSVDVFVGATSLTYSGDFSGQYSDPVTVSATLTDLATLSGIRYQVISFTIGSQTATATTNALGFASTTITLNQPSGPYDVVSSFAGNSTAGYGSSDDSDLFTINKETVVITYTGDLLVWTAGPTITTTPVRLSATLAQEDAYLGDLTLARVRFELYKSTNLGTTPDIIIGNIPVSPSIDGSTGEALTTRTLTIDIWSIIVKIEPTNAYWTQTEVGTGTTTVDAGTTEQKVTGGGWIPDAESMNGKDNFGFVVKYLKNGAPKGNFVFMFKSADGYTYMVKSNSWSKGGLSFSSIDKAFFTGKCNIFRIDRTTGEVTTYMSPCKFAVDITDGDLSTPCRTDTIAITIFGSSGSIWKQMGTFSNQIQLGGGSIVIRRK